MGNQLDTHLAVTPSWGSRLIGMEGLRGLAAVTVLIGHVGTHLAAGVQHPTYMTAPLSIMGQGLTLFFALSGFLLFRPFASAIVADRDLPSISRFFTNRFIRIFPAYIFILFFVSLVIGKAYTSSVPEGQTVEGAGQAVGYMNDPLLLITNGLMVHTLFPATIKTGLGVAWTLSIELVFYLVLPLLAWAAYKLARRGEDRILLALMPAFAVFIIGCAGRIAVAAISNPATKQEEFFLNWGANWTAVLARSFVANADLFSFGMFAAVIVALFESRKIRSRNLQKVRWGALLGGALIAFALRQTPIADTAFALAGAALILFIVLPPAKGRPQGIGARVFDWLPVRYVGVVSYSMYLWHVPVIWVLRDMQLTFPATVSGFWGNVLLVFVATMVLSTMTYELIEKQALRFKKRTDNKPKPAPALETARAAT